MLRAPIPTNPVRCEQAREGRGEVVDHALRIAQRISLALHQGNARAILKRLPLAPLDSERLCTLPSTPEDAELTDGVDGEWEWDPALEIPPPSRPFPRSLPP